MTGKLRDLNKKDIEIFGLQDKEQVLGINLFDNPNIPEEIKAQLRQGQDVDFRIQYDFKAIDSYYASQQRGVKDLIVKVTFIQYE